MGLADDQELSAKLESELTSEKESRDSSQLPPAMQEYLDSSSFEVGSLNRSFKVDAHHVTAQRCTRQ